MRPVDLHERQQREMLGDELDIALPIRQFHLVDHGRAPFARGRRPGDDLEAGDEVGLLVDSRMIRRHRRELPVEQIRRHRQIGIAQRCALERLRCRGFRIRS